LCSWQDKQVKVWKLVGLVWQVAQEAHLPLCLPE
jgi:hypothetical protein